MLKFRIKKFKKTETANIIVNFQDGKKLITDLKSGWKIGPDWAQQHLWHDSMTKQNTYRITLNNLNYIFYIAFYVELFLHVCKLNMTLRFGEGFSTYKLV